MKRFILPALILLALAATAYFALRPTPLILDIGPVTRGPIREFVAEEAKTRLTHDHTISLPESGDLMRVSLEVGDEVKKGDIVARLDDFELQQQRAAIDALIDQSEAQVTGVDVAKPKTEDLESALVRIREAEDAAAIARKERDIAGSRLAQAERDHQRLQAMLARGIASPAEADTAETAYLSTRDQLAAAGLAIQSRESELQLARLAQQRLSGSIDDNEYMRQAHEAEITRLRTQREIITNKLDKLAIKSPISGIVMEIFEENPRTLPAGSPILKLGDPAAIEIECDILSDEIGRIKEGNPVELYGPAVPAETARGSVRRIYPAAFTKLSSLGIEQQRVRVLIGFDNSQLNLRPGTRLDLRIITSEKQDALTIPDRAIFRDGNQHYVFRVQDGRAARTAVTLGLRNDTTAEIVSGIGESDEIIYEPTTTLTDEALVAPRE